MRPRTECTIDLRRRYRQSRAKIARDAKAGAGIGTARAHHTRQSRSESIGDRVRPAQAARSDTLDDILAADDRDELITLAASYNRWR